MATQRNQGTVASGSSTVQQVVDFIERKIRSQEFRSGDRVPTESELCALLGVSRTSVSEAIKILESMTLVQVRRGDGTYISNPKDITFYTAWKFKMILEGTTWREVLEFREQMEFNLLRCAITHATKEDMQQLRQNYLETHHVCQYDPDNEEALARLDSAFNSLLAKATKNHMLEEMYRFTFDIVTPLILADSENKEAADSTLIVHGLILEALEKRDLFLAANAAHQGVDYWTKLAQKQTSDLFLFEP